MAPPDAIVLLAHGSPDPDWMVPVDRAAALVRARAPGCVVRTATLEHGPTLLAAVTELAAAGAREVAVIPFFLSPGGKHVKRDLPALVAAVQADVPGSRLRLSPGALGTDDGVLAALADAALVRAGLKDMP